MGKGDKKSRKGKIAMGSYGVLRPRKKTNTKATTVKAKSARPAVEKTAAVNKVEAPAKKVAPVKKAAAPKAEAPAKKAAPKKAPKKAE